MPTGMPALSETTLRGHFYICVVLGLDEDGGRRALGRGQPPYVRNRQHLVQSLSRFLLITAVAALREHPPVASVGERSAAEHGACKIIE